MNEKMAAWPPGSNLWRGTAMTEETKEKKTLGEILRHPLANVVVGFLLTGVLGTTITQYYNALRAKQTQQHELATARKDSIEGLSALNAEYLARAGMLLAAIERGDETAAAKLKGAFDDAALRWQIEKPPTLLAVRDALPEEIYIQIRDQLEQGFRDRFLVPVGRCLESAMEALREGRDVTGVLQACKAQNYLTQAKACSRVLIDMLYELSGYTVGGRPEEAMQANQTTYRHALQQACSMTQ